MANKIVQLKDGSDNVYPVPAIKRKEYSFTTSPNQYVSPFTHYIDIPIDIDVNRIVGVFTVNTRSVDIFVTTLIAGEVFIYSNKQASGTLVITYMN